MNGRRTSGDRALLVLTLALLCGPVLDDARWVVEYGVPTRPPVPATEELDRFELWLWVGFIADRAGVTGTALAWAAVAWRCRGFTPRAAALVAAVAFAGLTAAARLAPDTYRVTAPAWSGSGISGGGVFMFPVAPPGDAWKVTAVARLDAGLALVHRAGWLPAVLLLAFGRRWGDRPRA